MKDDRHSRLRDSREDASTAHEVPETDRTRSPSHRLLPLPTTISLPR